MGPQGTRQNGGILMVYSSPTSLAFSLTLRMTAVLGKYCISTVAHGGCKFETLVPLEK